jgi:hypothetical protein
MTNYIILALCLIVLIAYLFDITSKYTKIPGIVLLICLGIAIRMMADSANLKIPNLEPYLPVIGTLGLIMIVMEASLDLKLQKSKINLITRSVAAAIILLVVFIIIFNYILVRFMGVEPVTSLLTAIPLGIIGSTVAISSTGGLTSDQKEFVVFESSISDIIGILLFDFILVNHGSIGIGLITFTLKGLVTVILATVMTAGLAFLLHKTRYHVNYVIIMTCVVMIYILGKIAHLPALFLVLVFGLVLSNNKYIEKSIVRRWVNFEKFRNDVSSFQKILGEMTFLIKSFFFIMFGYYTSLAGVFYLSNLVTAGTITLGILLLRWIYFATVLKMPAIPLVFFAPRGLITILLFLSIPAAFRIPFITEEVVTLVIFMSILVMMMGNMLHRKAGVSVSS